MKFGTEYYDKIYSNKSINYFKRYNAVYIKIMKSVNKDDIVLDLGCGMGYFDACYLYGKCKDFLGIDFSHVGIQRSQQHFPHIKNKFRIFDITNLDKLNHPYTKVISTEVLEHIENDIEVISKIKSGTPFIFTVPAKEVTPSKSHLRSYTEDIIKTRYVKLLKIEYIEPVEWWFVVKSHRL